jgi:hypothetical protein
MAISNPYDAAKKVIKPAFPRARFRAFVLGPALRPGVVVKKPLIGPKDHDSVIRHARYLRYATKKALEGAGYSVDFGETPEMLAFWEKHFGSPDPGSSELLQADKISGAVIVYPSSVGSMCELGMFAPQARISEKTLAIVHKRYKNDKSFFRTALLEVLAQENGRFEFRDYSKHDACIAVAVKFVAGKYQRVLRELGIIERGDSLKKKFRGTIFDKKG